MAKQFLISVAVRKVVMVKGKAVARYKQISHITIMIYPGANVLYKHFEFSIGSLLTAKSCFVWFLWC